MRSAIDMAVQSPIFSRTIAAICVMEMNGGTVVYESHSDLLLRPASITKIFTTAGALFSPDPLTAFSTTIAGTANDDGHTWKLYLRGGADPLLTEKDIQNIVKKISGRGISAISTIVIDESFLDTIRTCAGWMIDDEDDSFQPYISSLPIDNNRVVVTATGTRRTEAVRISINPAWDIFTVQNDAVTGERDSLLVTRRRGSNTIIVSGMLKPGHARKKELSIWNPPAVAHARLIAQCRSAGIDIVDPLPLRGITPATAEIIGEIRRPLSRVITRMNCWSDNLCAESLLKSISAEPGHPGSTQESLRLIRNSFGARGIDTTAFRLVDGSGISYYNLATPRVTAELLYSLWKSDFRDTFLRTLAIPGNAGTMRHRMKGSRGKARIHAKTGTLRDVSNLAGYVLSEKGIPLCFALYMQNCSDSTARYKDVQDSIVAALIDFSESFRAARHSR